MDTVLLNLAYLAYVTASLLPGGLKLRLGLVAQSLVFLTWGVATQTWPTVGWNIAFTGVNVYKAWRIARRNAIELTEEEEGIRRDLFPTLSRRDFLLLWSSGQDASADAGQQLCADGESQHELLLLLEGAVDVTNERGLHRERLPPSFIGEMSFFSGEPASADVVATESVRFRRWLQDDLRALQTLNRECASALQDALGRDVARKLRS